MPRTGRPTKYRPEHCKMLVDHMKKGLSFETFSATIGVNRSILYDWVKRHKQFAAAKEEGTVASMLFWERIGIGIATGVYKQGNPAVWIYNMKCRFPKQWMTKKQITIEARYQNDLNQIEKMSAFELAEAAKDAAKYLAENASLEEPKVIDVESED